MGKQYPQHIPSLNSYKLSAAILMWTYYSTHAGNLENCSWTSLVLITPSIPLITLPLHHYAWAHFMLNFHLRNGWYCIRRMQETTACIGYGTASVHGSRPENCMVMNPLKSTWGMEAGQKWAGMR